MIFIEWLYLWFLIFVMSLLVNLEIYCRVSFFFLLLYLLVVISLRKKLMCWSFKDFKK